MKSTFAAGIAGLLLLSAPVARASDRPPEVFIPIPTSGLSGEVSYFVRSAYVWDGITYADRAVGQWELSLEFADVPNLTLVLWGSNGFDGDSSGDYDDEIDLEAYYEIPLTERLSLTLSAGYYDSVPKLLSFGDGDVWALRGRADYAITDAVSVYAELTHYWLRGFGPGYKGTVLRVGAEATWLGIDWGVCGIEDDGILGYVPGFTVELSAAKTWKLGERWWLVLPEITAFVPLSGKADREAIVVIGAGLRMTF